MKHPDPKPRRRAGFWLGLPAVLLIFVLQMPASHLAALANDWCAGQCRLASVDGPWWAGRGFLFIKSPTDRGWHALGAMSWRLLPARNELAELHLGGGTAVLQIDTQGLHLRLDSVTLPAAAVLTHQAFNLPTAGWSGTLRLNQTTLHWQGNNQFSSQGHLAWLGARSSLLEDHPLGDLGLSWTWQSGHTLQARIEGGRPGEIELHGLLSHTPAGTGQAASRTLSGELRLGEAARLRLEKYVHFVGQASAGTPGHYVLAWQGP
jgi:hypothetical protein